MRQADTIYCTFMRMLITVALFFGCYGIAHPSYHCNDSVRTNLLSYRDSLIQEMVGFIQPSTRLSKAERKRIETRISTFPHKVIRRDTTSFFINTAYAMAYYEFYKHDYKKAKRWVDDFNKHGMPHGLLPSIFRYSSVGFNAVSALYGEGRLKSKKDKNSWLLPIKLSFSDSLKFDLRRTPAQFMDSYLDDVPMDCCVDTYRKLLTLFKDGGGRLEWLNGFTQSGFVQRCVDAGRQDVLDVVKELWGVELSDFTIGRSGYLEYRNNAIKVDSLAIAKVKYEILSFDPKRILHELDSIISTDKYPIIDSRVLRLLEVYYARYAFNDVVKTCEDYNQYLRSTQLNTLHDYWGLALSNLGRYEEALRHYDIAISNSANGEVRSTMRLNKACTLGEMGRSEEAISLFMAEKDSSTTPFDHFTWNDNLGYVYSFIDPTSALYYYNCAERFLDKSTLYQERKIRHFCRKARVLEDNKYLQRVSIEEALKFTRDNFCPDIAKGVAYTELGRFDMSVFDYEEADKYFTMAYEMLSRLVKEDRRVAYLNLNYAENLCHLDRYEEAVQVLIRQLNTNEELYGADSDEYFQVLRKLLLVAFEHPELDLSSEELHDKYAQLKVIKTLLTSSYENALVDISYGLYKQDWITVRQLLEDALNKPFTSLQRLELYQIYEKACRKYCTTHEYQQIIQNLIPLIKTDIINGLLLLTGNEKRSMQIPLSEIIDGAICKGAYDHALELSLFRKGLLFATRQAVEQKLAKGRKSKRSYQNLIQFRKELNSAIEYNDTIHIPLLSASANALERELSQIISSDKEFYHAIDKTIPMVTSALGQSDIAVDFIRYRIDNEYHFGAFVINSDGLVKFIALGEESEMKSYPDTIWQFLGDDVFSNVSTIYFSPDGFLNHIGIEYLPIAYATPISTKYNLHRVFHLSDIKPATDIGKDIVAIGISDHNSPIGKGETIDRGTWTDLPNVKYEIQLIATTLDRLSPRLLFNDEASEPTIKTLSGSDLSTLHISTHGFFRNFQQLEASAKDSSSYDYNISRRFLASGRTSVSGLVLRQGNLSWQSPEILEEYDDLLVSEEIETMNFPNLRLTVLSACDTGLGDTDSEGVWGLQRAFRIAGTKSLICSLSKVDDYWSAQFMDAFYEQAALGATIYDSFQKAQKWLQRELPDNPEIWSSFILIE